MSVLLEHLILEKNRIIELLGLKGIGKSSIARNLLHFTKDRKMFTSGILLVKLKDIKSTFVMLKLIMREILQSLKIDKDEKRALVGKICS